MSPVVAHPAAVTEEPVGQEAATQPVPAEFLTKPVSHAQAVLTVLPHPVHVAVECALAGTVTAAQVDVQVLYLPLQH